LTKLAEHKGINNSSEKLKFLGFLGLIFKSCIFLKILEVKGSTWTQKVQRWTPKVQRCT